MSPSVQPRMARFYYCIARYLVVLLIGSVLLIQNANAAVCTAGSNNSITLPSFTQNLNALPVNSPIGGVISSSPSPIRQFTCNSTMSFGIYTSGNYISTINGQRVFSTNIAGIGYAVGISGYLGTQYGNISCPSSTTWIGATDSTMFSPQPYEPNNYFNCSLVNTSGSYYATFYLQFYKTAPVVGSGTLDLSGQIYLGAYNGNLDGARPLVTTPSNIVNTSCTTINISPNTVSLPAINTGQLPSINNTAGNTTFNITLNCPSLVNLYMTMTDMNNISQTGNILTPDSSSTSKGVGLQLKNHRNEIISYGPDSVASGNTNQFFLQNFSGQMSFPFSVSYIRTGILSPGSLSARATFTLSYQ